MPVSYRRRLPVPEFCAVCGEEIPGRYEHRGPPRTVCLDKRCETRRDAARRVLRSAQEARP